MRFLVGLDPLNPLGFRSRFEGIEWVQWPNHCGRWAVPIGNGKKIHYANEEDARSQLIHQRMASMGVVWREE